MGSIVVVRATKQERYAPRAQGNQRNVDNWLQNALLRESELSTSQTRTHATRVKAPEIQAGTREISAYEKALPNIG